MTDPTLPDNGTIHRVEKNRGPDFAPIPFMIETVTAPTLKDSKGRSISTVIAKPISEEEQKKAEVVSRNDEDAVLIALHESPKPYLSMADLALLCGWRTNKSKVQRAADRLKKGKLQSVERGGLSLPSRVNGPQR